MYAARTDTRPAAGPRASAEPSKRPQPTHRWVGAALVDLGLGEAARAEHAARTGRHVIRTGTQIDVLEVYCARCRVRYAAQAIDEPCRTVVARAG
jgi:hypothetical protein